MRSAIITLSIEIELAWGRLDKEGGLQEFSPGRKEETKTLKELLVICDKLKIPFSFDVVGHLLHGQCNGRHSGPYPEDWFEPDPGTNVDQDPLFYAPDLIQSIKDAEVSHEICTHTYSHILHERMSPKVLDQELEKVEDVYKQFGLEKPVSFVSPRHQTSFKEVLKEHGIQIIRKPFPDYELSSIQAFRSLLKPSHPYRKAKKVDGLIETYCRPDPYLASPLLPRGQRGRKKFFRILPTCLRQRLHYHNLKKITYSAVQRETQLHLWSHLMNISNRFQLEVIEKFLKKLAELKKTKKVKIKTMSELADYAREKRYER